MTNVDFAFLAFLLLLGLFGYLSGAIRQLTHWAGLALAYLCAGPLAAKFAPAVTPRLTPLLPPKIQLSPAVVNMGLASALFSAIFVLGTVFLSGLAARILGAQEDSRINRAGGFLLGSGKGAVLVFAALAVMLFLEKPLTEAFGSLPKPLAKSVAVGFVRAHNPLEAAPLPALAKIEKLMAALRDPKEAEALLRDPELRKLLADPALKNDPRIAELLKDARFAVKP